MPEKVKLLVWQVSPWWKEEQRRRGSICFLAVGEVPRQSHRHCTCDEINADDVSVENGEGETMISIFLQSNLFIRRKTVLMPTSLHNDDGD